jgi:hypothetical protein
LRVLGALGYRPTVRPKYGTCWFGATTAVPMLTVKNFEVPAQEPLRSRNQYFPAWIAAVAEPQNFVAAFPPTFVFPGTQRRLPARPVPAESETASRRAMPAVRTISARGLRDGHLARTRRGVASS